MWSRGAYIMITRNLFAGTFALVSLFLFEMGGQPASAVTLSNGDAAIYNFDLTGQTPPPPYDVMIIEFQFSPIGFIPASIDVFEGLNATGALAAHIPNGSFTSTYFLFVSSAGVLGDGIFSVEISATGQIEVLSVAADVQVFSPPSFLSGVPGELATPLPAALPLFATGLSGLGLLGWRRKRKQAA